MQSVNQVFLCESFASVVFEGQGVVIIAEICNHFCAQALAISKETYLRINCEGMLSVQHQVSTYSYIINSSMVDICFDRYEISEGGTTLISITFYLLLRIPSCDLTSAAVCKFAFKLMFEVVLKL